MSGILLNCWGEKGWGAEPDTEVTITFSKLFHGASCVFRLILWLAHNGFLQTVISEENNWIKLQVLKIATFKCRRLNLTNFGKTLNDILTVNVRLYISPYFSNFASRDKTTVFMEKRSQSMEHFVIITCKKRATLAKLKSISWCLHHLICLNQNVAFT